MGMLDRLLKAHPDVAIVAYDGHYRRIPDCEMHLVHHLEVRQGLRSTTIPAVEQGRRKEPKAKAIEARLDRLITQFEQAA